MIEKKETGKEGDEEREKKYERVEVWREEDKTGGGERRSTRE